MAYTDDIFGPLGAPAFLKRKIGKGFLYAVALLKDYVVQGALEAVKARFPTYATVDALPALADERLMPRQGPRETLATYRTRLQQAMLWHGLRGTALGLQAFLVNAGYPSAVVYESTQIFGSEVIGQLAAWSQFYVVFYDNPTTLAGAMYPFTAPTDGKWGDAGTWDDGGQWVDGVSPTELAWLRGVIEWFRTYGQRCGAIAAQVTGKVWDGTWSFDGSQSFGGEVLEFTATSSP